MADEKEKIPPAPEYPVQNISRNNEIISLRLYRVLKGDRKNKYYPAPDFTNPNDTDKNLKWLGAPMALAIVQTYVKKAFQDIFFSKQVFKEDGTIDWAVFQQKAADFTAAAMKLSEIDDAIEEAQAKMMQLTDKTDFDTATPEQMKAFKKQMDAISGQIRSLKEMREERSKSRTADEEKPGEASVAVE